MSELITKFVASPELIARNQEDLRVRRYPAERIEVEFETTPEFVRAVLPPCFEPADTPSGAIKVGRIESKSFGPFDSAVIDLKMRYKDIEGRYLLLMVISGDMPVTIGRELWGEPKKTGTSEIFHRVNGIHAYGMRHGTRLIDIDAELGPDIGPVTTSGHAIELKAFIDAEGKGLDADPVVVVSDAISTWDVVREGTATVNLTGSPWDPVDEIPIVSLGTARYTIGSIESRTSGQYVQTEPDRNSYLPYVWGRNYDDPSLHIESRG